MVTIFPVTFKDDAPPNIRGMTAGAGTEIRGRRICRISHNPPPLLSCFAADKSKDQKRLTLLEGTGRIILKVREIIKVIEAEGWYLVTTKGSHRQYKHPVKTGRITIAGHLNDDLAPGTMNSICKQAKIKE